MICSPSGFCFSSSWSMVSCGKRGSLLVAGPANIVAANQPPAAAIASDEMKTDVECMFPPNTFACATSLKHDPEKWAPVFRKDHASNKVLRGDVNQGRWKLIEPDCRS